MVDVGGILVEKDDLDRLCRRYRVRSLALFGSRRHGRPEPESDVDVLVEFERDARVGLRFITLQDELSALFGRKVDLNTPGSLSRHFRDKVVRDAVRSYEAA